MQCRAGVEEGYRAQDTVDSEGTWTEGLVNDRPSKRVNVPAAIVRSVSEAQGSVPAGSSVPNSYCESVTLECLRPMPLAVVKETILAAL